MTDTTALFSSDKPYATAAEHEGIGEVSKIETSGTDEYDGQAFAYVKVTCVDKPIRLNKTNGRGLAAKFGPDTDGWVNRDVFVTCRSGTFDDGRAWTGWVLSPVESRTTAKPAGNDKPFNDDIPF